ncbi:MAG: nucleoside triphosphate pyrophosphohydrolase [Rhodospirillales bacterium]|nr:nucleoside triphosphate pyrophosphohydrolase [Rhodospirillales bacterium]
MSTDIRDLLAIMTRLRDPERGCPWDVEQSFATIAPYTIEEAYEVADAIERNDMAALKDELGDLLLQVVYHAEMAREIGAFAFDDVVAAICDKMVRRHPHVFGDAVVESAAAQTERWEQHKAAERGAANPEPAGALDGVPRTLPALTRALKLQKRAARVGFDWPDAVSALAKFDEESGELADEIAAGAPADRLEDEIGDLLFSCVNVARKLTLDPEAALRRATRKFERRFERIEAMLAADGGRRPEDADLDELERLWTAAKRFEARLTDD